MKSRFDIEKFEHEKTPLLKMRGVLLVGGSFFKVHIQSVVI